MIATTVFTQPVLSLAPPRLLSLDIAGPAGRLEAVVNQGSPQAPFCALVCHPHPLGGGNLHNKVVYHAMKVFNDPRWGFNWPVLRMNFRGVGLSDGIHDGEAETGDVLAALRWLQSEFQLPVVLAGFSFGAAMAISACSSRDESIAGVRALAALGLPTQNGSHTYSYPALEHLTIPKFFVSGDRDQFAPADELSRIVASASEPKKFSLITSSDHFFTGHLAAMQKQLAAWLKEQLQ
jgi:alpha/beta superfamily hydrolase